MEFSDHLCLFTALLGVLFLHEDINDIDIDIKVINYKLKTIIFLLLFI